MDANCFYCQFEITGKPFEVSGKYFHWGCVRTIVEDHIRDTEDLEKAIDKRAEELADELGYTKGGESL